MRWGAASGEVEWFSIHKVIVLLSEESGRVLKDATETPPEIAALAPQEQILALYGSQKIGDQIAAISRVMEPLMEDILSLFASEASPGRWEAFLKAYHDSP